MGQLLSCEFSAEVDELIASDDATGKHADSRIAQLEVHGFRHTWWSEDSQEAGMLRELGAQIVRCKVHDGGPFWFWERAAWGDGYVRMVYAPILDLVAELQRILFITTGDAEADARNRVDRIAALAALPNKLTQTDLLALDTVVRLGNAQAVLRFLEAVSS